jgi:hypothetical protein
MEEVAPRRSSLLSRGHVDHERGAVRFVCDALADAADGADAMEPARADDDEVGRP